MIAERTFNVGDLLDILTNEQIFDAISEDGATVETIDFDVIRNIWVSFTVDGIVIGAAKFKQMFSNTYDCHIHILPEHRKSHTLAAGEELVKWCKENMKGCLLYTNTPVYCESVERFLIKFGFEKSGILKQAWTKNGVKHDMNIYTRVI